VAIIAALAAVLTACTAPGGVPADDPRSTQIPALEEFHTQELAWEDCADYAITAQDEKYFPLAPEAECARMLVPMDYADPTGDTASVAVVRVPARGESQGSLFFNPGGPGGAGLLGTIGASSLMTESAVTESFDLIGFDPRGVGATEPAIDCKLTDGSAEGEDLLARIGSPIPTLTEDDTKELADRCAEGSGGMEALANVGTRTTAKDMDVLRAILGEDQLNFLGQSYGTRLGAIYAEEFPENVRAMILDGAFDPNLGSQKRLLASYGGFQASYEDFAAFCATQADCPLGTDPSGWTAAVHGILQPLVDNPVPAGDTELNFDAGLGGVLASFYSPDLWPLAIEGLREVQQGRGDQLLQLATGIAGISDEGQSSNMTDASIAINCVDEDLLDADELAQLREDTYAQAPIMDPGTSADEPTRDKCADFPVTGELGIPYAQDIADLPPTLVISLTGDAATPYEGAIELAKTLGGTLLTVEGEGHTVIGNGVNACADAIAAAYLLDLELPENAPELTCAAEQ
jgi:pimeloyl-ACP methyl ester carboxylesterase